MISLNRPNYYSTPFFNTSQKTEILDDVKNSIEDADIIIINKLFNLRNLLTAERLSIASIKQQIDELSAYNKSQNYEYLVNLLRPEAARGSKIPSQIPVPSCSFQLHNSITLTTNDKGNVAFFMNPDFLAGESAIGVPLGTIGNYKYYSHSYLSTAWINNNDQLTGNAPNNNWGPVNFGQTLPDVYEQYRLVSASMVVTYIGRLDSVQGIVGGAIFFGENDTIGGLVQQYNDEEQYNPQGGGLQTVAPALTKYGNFDFAQDAFYSQQNKTLEGVRMLYFPIDNSFEEYTKVMDNATINANQTLQDGHVMYQVGEDYYKAGFNWFFYSQGAPTNSPCFKVDIYCNFECLPSAAFLNYMPISVNPLHVPGDEKKKSILFVQSHPIMKSNEDICDSVAPPSIFTNMIKKFRNGLPCFDKLRAMGLMGAIPGLKPGLALAGNMIQQSMQLDNYC